MSDDVLHSIGNDARKGQIIVGDSAEGDRARFNCHVVDDIAAGVALLVSGNELLIKRGTYTVSTVITIPVTGIRVVFEDGAIISSDNDNDLFLVSGKQSVEFVGRGQLDGGNTDVVLIDIVDSSDIVIDGLDLFDTIGTGIAITRTAQAVRRIVINGCRLNNCDIGIHALSTAGDGVDGLKISNCDISGGDEEGIILDGCTQSSISTTRVENMGTGAGGFDGILIQSTDITSEEVLLDEVWCNGNGNDGDNNGSGVHIVDADRCILVKVSPTQNQDHGIELENADNCTVSSGNSTGNAADGINIDAASDGNIILGNQLTGNAGNSLVDNGTNTDAGHNIT